MTKQAQTVSKKLLQNFLQLAAKELKGDWVLLGGTVLPLISSNQRVTTDIDLVGIGDPKQSETLKLMSIAEKLGLPPEAINQAAALFLKRIKGFEKHLVPIAESRNASIYRPDIVLFYQLKVQRLSEADLSDCMAFLHFERNSKDGVPFKKLEAIVNRELKNSDRPEKSQRLRLLLETLRRG